MSIRDMKSFRVNATTNLTAAQHEKLIQHVHKRLRLAKSVRDSLAQRYTKIDRDLAGWLQLNAEEKERVRENVKRGTLKLTDVNLQLAGSQLDEEITYLMSVFAPDTSMFEGADARNKQPFVKAFSLLMNEHSTKGQYYRQYVKAFTDMLKYNLGGFITNWVKLKGKKVISDPATGLPKPIETVVWEGNQIQALDMYNTLWDPNVNPVDVPIIGEFVAPISIVSEHRLNLMRRDEQIFYEGAFDKLRNGGSGVRYWQANPTIRVDYSTDGDGTDWNAIMSQNMGSDYGPCFEIIDFYCHIDPTEFGLKSSTRKKEDMGKLEIWRIKVLNGELILAATELTNAHGMLPCAFGMPLEDSMGLQTRSYAETLIPLQQFASFLLNVYQRAARKALYGLTVFNPDVVDLKNQDIDYAGYVPVTPTGADLDVRKAVTSFTETPPVNNTMTDVDQIMGLMQSMLPTNVTAQVAGLERATQYQAAATVQGTNRRSHKMARMLHSQCFTTLNAQLIYNIYEYQPLIDLTDPNTGQQVQINPKDFRDAKIEFSISDGLKGIDRLMLIENYKQLLGMIVQIPEAARQIDLIAITNYISTLSGDQFDLTQFKFQNPFDALTVDQKNAAYQLLQQVVAQQQAAAQAGQQSAAPPDVIG